MEKETLYARFFSNELSDTEIQELKDTGEWGILQSIRTETDSWRLPEPTSEQYKVIRERIESLKKPEAKVVSINRWSWVYKAASVVLVATAAYWYFFQNDVVEINNLSGTTNSITLPDSTEIILTGVSRLVYDRENFVTDRKIEISGQVYARVKRKGRFVAMYNGGEVQVLGTEFEILSGESLARVKCFEGKVKVLPQGNSEIILHPGEGVKTRPVASISTRFTFSGREQNFNQGESLFDETTLDEVIEMLKIQFDIEVEAENIDMKRKYSGKFIHNDLDKALQMVFEPMGIQYSIIRKRKNKVILK